MTDIIITKLNEVFMKVTCAEHYMELDIQDRFSFEVPGAKYDPLVKSGKWDGIKKLYNRHTKKLYVGLLYELLELCEKRKWSYHIDKDLLLDDEILDDEDLKELIDFINPHDKGEPLTLYDYQYDGVKHMLNMNRSALLAATSAGKSLIIYIAMRIYQLSEEFREKKIFICVPSILLVEQLYSDFENYSNFKGSNWSVHKYCQKISNKYTKFVNSPIVITTWQSMAKLPFDVYETIGAIFVDEAHTASASVLTSILEKCTTTEFRHGLTGTLDKFECNQLVIQGLTGKAKRIIKAHELIAQGKATDVKINITVLNHPKSVREELKAIKSKKIKNKFQKEVEFVNSLQYRRKFILDIISSVGGNSIVLFDRVDSYGKELYEEYKKTHPNTFLVIGDTDVDTREDIRQNIELYDDAVIFATYQCMQQGVSIKKLHNLFFISSSKSIVRILQSLGRLMRLHESKDIANLYDIVDDLSIDNKYNYMYIHAGERLKMYEDEKYKISFNTFDMSKL